MTQKARDLAAQGIDVVTLSTGEPDFPTPKHAVFAGAELRDRLSLGEKRERNNFV